MAHRGSRMESVPWRRSWERREVPLFAGEVAALLVSEDGAIEEVSEVLAGGGFAELR